MRLQAGAIVGMLLMGAAAPRAQERVVVLANTSAGARIAEVDASISRFGEVRYVVPIPAGLFERPTVLSGARYVVWIAHTPHQTGLLRVFDRRTRVAATVEGLPLVGATLADAMRPRLFFVAWGAGAGIYELDAVTLRLRQIAAGSFGGALAFAARANHLYAVRPNYSIGADDIVAIDVGSAAERIRWPAAGAVASLHSDVAGDRLTAWVLPTPELRFDGLATYDAATGAELARRALGGITHPLVHDETRGHLLAGTTDGIATVLDAATLQTLSALRVSPQPGSIAGVQPFFSLLAGRWMTGGYVVRSEIRLLDRTCNRIAIDSRGPDGRTIATVDVLAALGAGSRGCDSAPVLVRSPFAPEAVRTRTAGRSVTVAWENAGNVSDFEIQAGWAPGATMLTQRVGLRTSVAFDDVPPGVYYVRVRAFNEVGGSPVSNEVRVEVK